jgi:hypothetical protein
MESRYFDMPPADMHSLIALPNEFMAAISGIDLCLSVTGKPHAWPIRYRPSADTPGVGLGVFEQTIVMLTQGTPYLIPATDPQSASMQQLDWPYACASRPSIVSVPGGVIYAAADGLCYVGSTGPAVLTNGFFDAKTWRAMFKPESMHAVFYDGKYIAFYDNGTEQACLVFDPRDERKPFVKLSIYCTAAWVERNTATLYMVRSNVLHEWETGAPLTARWRGKRTRLPHPMNFVWGQLKSDAYPMTFELWSNGALKASKSVANGKPFRLPSGYKSDDIACAIQGSGRCTSALLSTSIEELRGV